MQATVKYPRLAAVIAEIEKTGYSRAEIGRMAGRDGSGATRWAKGTHLPLWGAVKSLADAIRGDSPELADSLLEAWHYYSDPVERGPDSTIPDDVLRVIRDAVAKGERTQEWADLAIETLEAIDRGQSSEAG